MKIKLLFVVTLLSIFVSGPAYSRDITDSVFGMQFFGGLGGIFGDIIDVEESGRVYVLYSDGTVKSGSFEHLNAGFGVSLDIMPFGKAQFDTYAVKAGLRVLYSWNLVQESAEVGGGNYETKSWEALFMNYHSFLFGGIVNILPGSNTAQGRSSLFNCNFFALIGPIFGDLHGAAVAEEVDSSISTPKTNIKGFRVKPGIGLGMVIGAFDFGFNIAYSFDYIIMDKEIYINVNKESVLHEFEVEFYIGFHI